MDRRTRAAVLGWAVVGLSAAACDSAGSIAFTPNEVCIGDCTNLQAPDPANPNSESNIVDPNGTASTTRFPRLSHAQWESTIQDLFHLDAPSGLTTAFAPDPGSRFDTNVDLRTIDRTHWLDYQNASEILAARIVNDPAQLSRIVPSNLPTDPAASARMFVSTLGPRAFRRPLTLTEIDAYVALFQQGPSLIGGDAFNSGVEITLRAFLQSPHFLYRVEASSAVQNGRIPLSGYEMATRLSYALWNTMPSDALLAAAANGELDTPAGVEGWANTLLEDPRANATIVSFHEQLFRIASYGRTTKDPTRFPTFTTDLESVLQQEASLYIDEIVVNRGGGIRELLTTPITHVNDQLAGYYGLNGSFDTTMQQVDLDPTQRAGILTQLGFLSKNGGLVQSDPIHRGVFININLLCANLHPPAFQLPPLPAQQPGQTNRERIASHTGTCGAGCHDVYINPIGFAFEHYDAIGQWRDTDNDSPVDSTSTYRMDGTTLTYSDAVDLSRQLAETPRLHACYASTWMEFMLGRRAVPDDLAALQGVADASQSGATAKELLARITALESFRTRVPEGT
jgi:hypothetical protein